MDIRDPWAFVMGRWAWTRGGYEEGLPRGSQIGDIDGYLELNDRRLFIEVKEYHGQGLPGDLPKGQRYALRSLAQHPDHVVWVLYGCAHMNRPFLLRVWMAGRPERLVDWRAVSPELARDGLRAELAGFAQWAERREVVA